MLAIIEQSRKRAVETLYTDGDLQFADPTSAETLPITAALVTRIAVPELARLWEPQDLTGWTIRAAIGKSFLTPVAGSFTLTFGANTTDPIAYNATAGDVEDTLNLLASMIAAGGCTVSGENSYFFVTFTANGARAQITVDVTNLAPLAIGEYGTLIDGGAALQEVQTIRLIQNPGAYAVLDTANDAADAPVTVLQVGGGGLNHKVRVNLTPLPYAGRWTILVAGVESALIDFDSSAAEAQAIIEAISINEGALVIGRKYTIVTFEAGDDFTNVGAASNADGVVFTATGDTPTTWTNVSVLSPVGSGNVAVVKESEGQFLIVFQGALANTDLGAITTDASALQVLSTWSGTLDMRTAAIELLLNGEQEVDAFLEIEGTPPGEAPQTLFRRAVKVIGAVISPSALEPPPIADFEELFADTDFSGLPTADPGGGKPWLNGGVLQVGA